MSRLYFRRYYEAADDSGAADAVEPAEVEEVDAPEVEEAPEPQESYTRAELAELLGPRFERFASHEGPEAFRQFGSAYDSATGLIRQGAHLEPQDPSVYERIGIDPSEISQPEPDEAPGIFGAPWEQPTTWDEYVAYAQSDSPDQRRLAAYGVLQADGPDDATKQWFYNQWAQADPHGAAAYIQQSTMSAAEQRLADLEARLEARYAATHEDLLTRNSQDLMEAAKSQVKGFEDHAQGVLSLWNERVQQDAGYAERFLSAPRPEQIKELRRMTIIAAAESEPARTAAQAAAADETDAAKLRTRTETSRSNGAPDMDAAALKRQSIDEAKRVFGQVR